jgi:uncharacterized membrane protein SirB2
VLLLKSIHVGNVLLSFVSFSVRGVWMLQGSAMLQQRMVKVVPHVIDTVLLLSGIGLAVAIEQYPFVQSWLTAKILGIFGYIVLGAIALKHGHTRRVRVTSLVAAVLVFAYIVAVAVTRSPDPFG